MGFVFELVPEDKKEEYGLTIDKYYSFLWVADYDHNIFLIDKGISKENVGSFEFFYKEKSFCLEVFLDYSAPGKILYHIPIIDLKELGFDQDAWKESFVEALRKYHESRRLLRGREMQVRFRT